MPKTKNDLGLVLRAAHFAAHKHRDQRRKDADASPYINHPIALANVLANEGGVNDVTVLCAAVLHDTIEDTKTTAAELTDLFGSAVAAGRPRGDRRQVPGQARSEAAANRTRSPHIERSQACEAGGQDLQSPGHIGNAPGGLVARPKAGLL